MNGKKSWFAVFLFLAALFFLYRPAMLIGLPGIRLVIFTRSAFAVLAFALLLFRWEAFLGLFRKTHWLMAASVLVLFLSGLVHLALNRPFSVDSIGANLIYVFLPLMAAVWRKELLKILPGFMILFWCWNAVLLVLQLCRGAAPYGLAGNWNWSALLTLACAPFVLQELARIPHKGVRVLLTGFAVAASGAMIVLCRSRAAILALAVCVLAELLLYFPAARRRIVFGTFSLAVIGAAVILLGFPEEVSAFLSGEIRPPLWEAACRMLAAHPFGVGAEWFENTFLDFRGVDYFLISVSAVRSTHPHNEILFLACSLGIPAALAWICWNVKMFAARFTRCSEMNGTERMMLFAYGAFTVCSMFDLTFYSWPSDALALIFLGILSFPEPEAVPARTGIPVRVCASLVLLISLTSAFCSYESSMSWRQGYLTYSETVRPGKNEEAERCFFRAASLAPEDPEPILNAADYAYGTMRNPTLALRMTDFLKHSAHPDFGRVHALRANCFALAGDNEKALAEYRRDAELFPLLVLPRTGMISSLKRMGRYGEAFAEEKKLNSLLEFRGLSPAALKKIMENPELDRGLR